MTDNDAMSAGNKVICLPRDNFFARAMPYDK